MDAIVHPDADPARSAERLRNWRQTWGPGLATFAIPFLLIVYTALQGGGYDSVVRGEVGVAVWWLVLLGAVVGLLPTARLTVSAWVGIGTLAAIVLWTALGISWSESSEKSTIELARVATYLGVLVLALCVQGRDGLKRTAIAVACAAAAIAALALLSRLHPQWFPENETASVLEYARARLNYPLDYWNGIATLTAMGIPLMVVIAIEGRRLVVQALATAAIPLMALTCYYTLSRGGVLEIAIAVLALFILLPRRLAALPILTLVGTGSGLLIAAASQRPELENGLNNAIALEQGDEMLAIVLIVCEGVALASVGLGLAVRHGLGPRWRPRPRAVVAVGATAASIAAIGLIAGGATAGLNDAWAEFKAPAGPDAGDTSGRFESASGNGRYQYWQAAVEANATDPLVGIGPGSYEFYWAREGTLPGYVRDAHSLYLEMLAELGIVGLLLVGGAMIALLTYAVRRTLAAPDDARSWLAGATAACFAFAVAAAVDWVWELAVLPIGFLCLVAAVLSHRDRPPVAPGRSDLRTRAGLVVVALLAIPAVGVPLLGAGAVEASEEDFHAQQLDTALESARDADAIQPWAASPPLWEALVLERQGKLPAAAAAAVEATHEESTNWRTWVTLSRIEAYRGNTASSLEAYRTARDLNPRSGLFAR